MSKQPKDYKIFVTVGSRNYQFNRLFVKLDELYESGLLEGELFAQIGTSTYTPIHYQTPILLIYVL